MSDNIAQLQGLIKVLRKKSDQIALLFLGVLAKWLETDKTIWANNVETSYHNSRKEGTTVAVFSNMLGKVGMQSDDLPFFQVQAERRGKRLPESVVLPMFGLAEYFGEHYDLGGNPARHRATLGQMLVPFITFASVMLRSRKMKLWSVEVGDYKKREPLVLTFTSSTSVLRLALFGHILVHESEVIRAHYAPRIPLYLPDGEICKIEDWTEERLVKHLDAKVERVLYTPFEGGLVPIGNYGNVFLSAGSVRADVSLHNQDAIHGHLMELSLDSYLEEDPQRSKTKYRRGFITRQRSYRLVATLVPAEDA
jgi:hypothetical protein